MRPVPIVNTAIRAAGGKVAPRLKNPPVFSTYSSRIVSAMYDLPGWPASVAVAMCLLTRSHPIVVTTATNSATRTLILAIIFEPYAGRCPSLPRVTSVHHH